METIKTSIIGRNIHFCRTDMPKLAVVTLNTIHVIPEYNQRNDQLTRLSDTPFFRLKINPFNPSTNISSKITLSNDAANDIKE